MKFSAHCWMPFKQSIPLLYRHGRPVGEVQEVHADDGGLYVRVRVTDREARQCSYWSVGATVHHYMLRDVEDPQAFHGLVTCCSLDEVSLVPVEPANPAAIVQHRFRAAPVAPFLETLSEQADLSIKAVQLIQRKLEWLRQVAQSPAPHHRSKAPATTRPKTEFKRLVEAMNQQAEMRT